MSKKHEVMPTQDMYPQLAEALAEISNGHFRIMTDTVRPDVVRPVLYEPVFIGDGGVLTSQQLIYTASVATRPASAQQAIDRVASVIAATDAESNPVKYAMKQQSGFPDDEPDFLDEIIAKIDAQATNTARVIGGLLIVKDADTSVVGLRCVYNRALMSVSTTWELRDLALSGALHDGSTDGIKARNPNDLGNVAARMVLHCLAASKRFKPALIFAPTLGLRGM